MRDELLYYYERELSFLRRTGADFAKRYPKIAGRLLLEPNKCDDPHVERLLEGFALLAARVHLHLEDDFPEFSDALLGILYPHFTRPIPSMSVAELRLDPEQGKITKGFAVPRETELYSRPVGGTPCRFRTCYDTTLWPLSVTSAAWSAPHELKPAVRAPDATGALRIRLDCAKDVKLPSLEIEKLRQVAPDVILQEKFIQEGGEGAASPGMLAKHYAPDARLILVKGSPEATGKYIHKLAKEFLEGGLEVGILVADEDAKQYEDIPVKLENLGSHQDLEKIAANLFAAIRSLDQLPVDIILVGEFSTAGLGLAIRDRLVRAAAGQVIRVD